MLLYKLKKQSQPASPGPHLHWRLRKELTDVPKRLSLMKL